MTYSLRYRSAYKLAMTTITTEQAQPQEYGSRKYANRRDDAFLRNRALWFPAASLHLRPPQFSLGTARHFNFLRRMPDDKNYGIVKHISGTHSKHLSYKAGSMGCRTLDSLLRSPAYNHTSLAPSCEHFAV